MLLHLNVLLLAGASTASILVSHDRIPSAPNGWRYFGDAAHDEPCELHVALPESDMQSFQDRVLEISTPGHERYGKHMTQVEIDDWLRPSDDAIEGVVEWIQSHGVSSPDRYAHNMMSLKTTVGTANEMLGATFAWFENEQGVRVLRTLAYSTPQHIKGHISYIHPTVKFPNLRAQGSTIHQGTPVRAKSAGDPVSDAAGPDPSCAQNPTPDCVSNFPCYYATTPHCLLTRYNVHYKPVKTTKLAFATFLDARAIISDLHTFAKVANWTKGSNYKIIGLAGAVDDQNATIVVEPNLDGQYQTAVGWPNPVTEYLTDGDGPLIPGPNAVPGQNRNEPYVKFLQAMLAMNDSQLPATLSISYGEDEQSWPRAMAVQVCNLFAQLGARGVSVLTSSGDLGVGRNCTTNAGKPAFNPSFPGTCTFITSVGGSTSANTESWFERPAEYSSGGFSNFFAPASYQQKYVNAYLAQLGSYNAGFYNKSGRGFPDVAAYSDDYQVVDMGAIDDVLGTSASAPTFAGIISLLNSALVSNGKKPLGFLNPWLYSDQVAATFTDIKTNFTTGCLLNYDGGKHWNATTGWDPASGLGIPDFGKLLAIVAPGTPNKGGPVPA